LRLTSIQREIEAHKALSKTAKITETTRKQLDHFELNQGDRNYHFLIHEPLGATLQLFLDISRRSLPIYYAQDLTYQMLHALELIHGAQVIHGGPTLPLLLRYLIHSWL
jgi:serine/threonine protein kinase